MKLFNEKITEITLTCYSQSTIKIAEDNLKKKWKKWNHAFVSEAHEKPFFICLPPEFLHVSGPLTQ